MSSNIVKKSFYLTSLFADIKSEHNWTANEIKTVMILFSKMNDYRVYIPDFENIENIKEEIKKIPTEYTISKNEFLSITGVSIENSSREINKVRKRLGSKIINTPHPIEKNINSGMTIPWFTHITYSSDNAKLYLKLNSVALERLVAFVKYSKIQFESIAKLKSNYSVFSYLFFRIIKDISYNSRLQSEILDISEFKEKLSLKDKYTHIADFKKYVLEVINKEINEFTDINLDYELIKEGRSFTKIKFIFDYKPEYLEQKAKSKSKYLKTPQIIESTDVDDYDSPFEATLVNWGIRAKKVVELEEMYSLDVIQSAIDLTLEKEAAGEIKTTKAAIFLGILENKQLASDEQFEREQTIAREDQEKILKKQLADEYDAIQKEINDNADEISNYLSAKSINATYEITSELNERLLNMSCVDAERFKDFRPKLPVLHNGYYDMKNKKEVSPNMYQFISLIKRYSI